MRIFSLIVVVFSGFFANAQYISDESYQDEKFWAFRTELQYAILKRDIVKFSSFLADSVFHSPHVCDGPSCSKKEFIQYFLGHGKSDHAWEALQTVVKYGFFKVTDEHPEFPVPHDEVIFKAPSFIQQIDPENEVLILGKDVNIRKAPSLSSEVIQTASFETFRCDCNITETKPTTTTHSDNLDWLEIYLDETRVGYVAAKFTSYYLSYMMEIGKVGDEWKIISFYTDAGC